MAKQSFIKTSHFKIYDSIIPVFRLIVLFILGGFTISYEGLSQIGWSFSFLLLYLAYALFLLFFKTIRQQIVLKYPYIIGMCESLILTYGIASSGGPYSPVYLGYILVITFFGLIHSLQAALLISAFCCLSYDAVAFLTGKLSINVGISSAFLLIFAVFIGSISERISRYNIDMAVYDQLTGVYNRQYLYGTLEHLFSQNKLLKRPFALIMIDINDFKQINDEKGHLEGDRILKLVGEKIKRVVDSEVLVARYGGDEFVVLVQDDSGAKAQMLMKRITAILEEDLTDSISVSIGYGLYQAEDENVDQILHRADMQMYTHKQSHKQSQPQG